MTRRTSLVAICSRSRDSSCSATRFNSFLSWLSSVARGLFFFFEAPTLAMWVLLTPNLEDFQRLTVREADQKTPWPESLLDNEVECQPLRKSYLPHLSISSNANRICYVPQVKPTTHLESIRERTRQHRPWRSSPVPD